MIITDPWMVVLFLAMLWFFVADDDGDFFPFLVGGMFIAFIFFM